MLSPLLLLLLLWPLLLLLCCWGCSSPAPVPVPAPAAAPAPAPAPDTAAASAAAATATDTALQRLRPRPLLMPVPVPVLVLLFLHPLGTRAPCPGTPVVDGRQAGVPKLPTRLLTTLGSKLQEALGLMTSFRVLGSVGVCGVRWVRLRTQIRRRRGPEPCPKTLKPPQSAQNPNP